MYLSLPHIWIRSFHDDLTHASSVPMTPDEVTQKHGFIRMHDEVQLFYRLWEPEKSKAVVIMIPGIGGHSFYFDSVGEFLKSHGISLVGVDSRGQGLSFGRDGDLRSMEKIAEDIGDVIKWVKRKFPKQKIFLSGHSLGGAEVVFYLATKEKGCDGLILPAPAIKTVPNKIPTIDYVLFPWYFFINQRKRAIVAPEILASDYRKDCNDEKIVQTLVYDKLIINKFTVRYLTESAKIVAGIKELAKKVRVPTLLIQGTEDPSYKFGGKFFQNLATEDKEYQVIPGAKHFLFYDPSSAVVFNTILNWLKDRV